METEVTQGQAPQDKTVFYIYILYLVGLFLPVTALIGFVMAYINKGKDSLLDTHYSKQIRTFWIGLVCCVVGWLTAGIFVGVFILLAWMIWVIVTCVKGMKAFNNGQPA